MPVTQEQKKRLETDAEPLFANAGKPFDSLEQARKELESTPRPFVMFRYREKFPDADPDDPDDQDDRTRVRTAVLYEQDGDTFLIDPQPGDIHPVRLLLLTLTNLFFPKSNAPFPADDEIFDVIRGALEQAGLDAHSFDGGGIERG